MKYFAVSDIFEGKIISSVYPEGSCPDKDRPKVVIESGKFSDGLWQTYAQFIYDGRSFPWSIRSYGFSGRKESLEKINRRYPVKKGSPINGGIAVTPEHLEEVDCILREFDSGRAEEFIRILGLWL